MTPELAAALTLHDDTVADGALARRPRIVRERVGVRAPRRRPQVGVEAKAPLTLNQRESRYRRLLAAGDTLAAATTLLLVSSVLSSGESELAAIVVMPLVVLLFKVAGLYDADQRRLAPSTLDEAPLLLQVTGLYTLALAILQPLVLGTGLDGRVIGVLWLTTFAAVVAARVVARCIAGHTVSVQRCLIVAERQRADWIRSKLLASNARASVVATFPWAGDNTDLIDAAGLRRIVEELHVHRIIVAPTTTESADVVELIRLAKAAGAQVSVLPRMLEVVGSAVALEDVDGMTMFAVRPFGLSRSSRMLKRGFDLVATSVGLLVVGPLIAGIAIATRLDTRGPVFFRQVRVGRDGRPFRIFKFRSMVVGADAQKDLLRHLNEVGDGMFKISDDPRVTRVGRILRATSLDELPQVFNVLRGDMSLVGPRPLVTDEDAQVVGLARGRLHLTPGMTGTWQVLGTRAPMQEMIGMDYLYVANWSLWLDLKLLVRTVRHVLRGANV